MTFRERVPKPLRGPLGFGSLGLLVAAVAVGYVLTVLGFIFTMGIGAPEGLSKAEAGMVMIAGLASLAVSYLGWKGFNYFAY